MKRVICSLLTMVLLLGYMPTVKSYAATAEGSEIQKIVAEYMETRATNMQEKVSAEAWNDIVVKGIVRDEALYADKLQEANVEVFKVSFEIVSVKGEEIVDVVVLEKMEIGDGSAVNNIEVLHKICVVQNDNKEYVVVSDEYYDAYVNFASCSYVEETTLIDPCAAGGSSSCILYVAKNEVGYCEKKTNESLDSKTANAGDGNFTKYGEWYGLNGDKWCAIFVSWCANQASVSTNTIPKFALTEDGMKEFQSWGKFEDSIEYGGSYTPQPGDIFFLANSATDTYHTGIVVSVSGNTMTCVEGNTTNDMVEIKTRKLTATSLRGFGKPAYESLSHSWNTASTIVKCSLCGAAQYEIME